MISWLYHPDLFMVGFKIAFYDMTFELGITIFFWSLLITIGEANDKMAT